MLKDQFNLATLLKFGAHDPSKAIRGSRSLFVFSCSRVFAEVRFLFTEDSRRDPE